MRCPYVATLVWLVLAGGPALPVHADEMTPRAELLRAASREEYRLAKQHVDAADKKRMAAIARMQLVLDAAFADYKDSAAQTTQLGNRIATTQTELAEARTQLTFAKRAANQKTDAPAIIAASAKIAALQRDLDVLRQQLQTLRDAEAGKIVLPSGDQAYADLQAATTEKLAADTELSRAFARFMGVFKPPPPPYLQAVTITLDQERDLYQAEWRVDGRPSDEATRDFYARLDQYIFELTAQLHSIVDEREAGREARYWRARDMYALSAKLTAYGDIIERDVYAKIIGPAIVEAVGVVVEAVLTGGLSVAAHTLSDQATQAAVEAGKLSAEALAKRNAGVVLSGAEKALVDRIDGAAFKNAWMDKLLTDAPVTAFSKWKSQEIVGQISTRDATIIGAAPNPGRDVVDTYTADGLETLLQRSANGYLQYLSADAEKTVGQEVLARAKIWDGVVTGAQALPGSKLKWPSIRDALKGTRPQNYLSVISTTVKAALTAYFSVKEAEAKQEWANAYALLTFEYRLYHIALMADLKLAKMQDDTEQTRAAAIAYRFGTMGPRALNRQTDIVLPERRGRLDVRLKFSQPLDTAPDVKFGELTVRMGLVATGDAVHWIGHIEAGDIPEDLAQAKLEVSIGKDTKSWHDLDADPSTPTRFAVPDDIAAVIPPERQEWTDYDRGTDTHHRLRLNAKTDFPPPYRGVSTCEKITCDCDHLPPQALRGDFTIATAACRKVEAQLKKICLERKQVFITCSETFAGPAAYPKFSEWRAQRR